MISRFMRSLRRLRTAQVASAIIKTRPTRLAAVMTPTDRALFWRKDLGAASACKVEVGDEESLEVTVTVGGWVDVGVEVALGGGGDVAVSLVDGSKDVVEEVELVVSDVVVELEDVVLLIRLIARMRRTG